MASSTIEALRPPITQKGPTDTNRKGFPWHTILFNCNCHTFEEVARQLMKAIHCSYKRGMDFAEVVDRTGKAVVYTGPRERCEAVAAVLGDIGLIVKVAQ
ncbi:MAG: ATP-dependent Clp protease adaptor ClpS [Elusimicrobia bacterium]|nr:ATP-dependent Clp protease adaptor ClpS [Elusimicrobiota bacterium]